MRRTRLRRTSARRAGLSRAQQAVLKELHRTCVMTRAHASAVWEDVNGHPRKTPWWYGACERCGKMSALSVCHIKPQGAYPHMRYDPDNAWAGCYSCHLGPRGWHKDVTAGKDWIEKHLGTEAIWDLEVRSQAVKPIDFNLTKLYLERTRHGKV